MSDTRYAIHPAIGIARMGNAPASLDDPGSYYTGAEVPGETPNEGQPYKAGGRIKKQAQRFRIYEYSGGAAVREVTLDTPGVRAITWTVHLGNRKAALDVDPAARGTVSSPAVAVPDFHPAVTRNGWVPAEARESLAIDTGPQSCAPGEGMRPMAGQITMIPREGAPVSAEVQLGAIASEPATGRLLVFASDGHAAGLLDGRFSDSAEFQNAAGVDVWANSDTWYDSSADGRVTARIAFEDGTSAVLEDPLSAAWVICAVPRYAPGLPYFTDLHHVAVNAAHAPGTPVPRPSFARDIYPVLRSAALLRWVSARGAAGHGHGRNAYLDAARLRLMADNDPDPDSQACMARKAVFRFLRDPASIPPRPHTFTAEETGPRLMPQLPEDVIERPGGEDWSIPAVTPVQYEMLRQWALGDFEADGLPHVTPLAALAVDQQPEALDRGALDGSAGTPFYPGIESWNIFEQPALYAGPLRIGADARPGDLTMANALPWQADYLDCDETWWPVQRPTHVTRGTRPLQPWVPPDWELDYGAMVKHWWTLGFVIKSPLSDVYLETERSAEDGLR